MENNGFCQRVIEAEVVRLLSHERKTMKIMIGCGNQAYIYLDRFCPSDPLELTLLQDA
jgi:hypothetical protein